MKENNLISVFLLFVVAVGLTLGCKTLTSTFDNSLADDTDEAK